VRGGDGGEAVPGRSCGGLHRCAMLAHLWHTCATLAHCPCRAGARLDIPPVLVSPFSVYLDHWGTVWFRMALVRILVDGYSLLHNWPGLAPGRERHSAAARDELIRRLTLYQDAAGTPVTIFFDGAQVHSGRPAAASASEVEVLYSRRGQTADQMIERAVHRFRPYGEVLAVTDDYAERDTVISFGGNVSSCWNFIVSVENALAELGDGIKHHNRRERHGFRQRR
jgi:uncharacterized protein